VTIDRDDFAIDCVNQGLFFGVNPHFLVAVANSLSGIKDDTDGTKIGPFRLVQVDWDAKLTDPLFDSSLQSSDISDPGMQTIFAAVQTLHAQEALVKSLNRYPSANELYAKWPATPALPADGLQKPLDDTRALISSAVLSALEGIDEEPVTGNVNFSSIAPGARLDNAHLIVRLFQEAGYATVHQIAALANAVAESNLNANAMFSTAQEHSVGLFQLNTKGGVGAGHSDPQLKDPTTNTKLIIAKANTVADFKAAANLHDAVAIFVKKIEQPANQAGEIVKRLSIAQKFVTA
jgi:hypothetical protein